MDDQQGFSEFWWSGWETAVDSIFKIKSMAFGGGERFCSLFVPPFDNIVGSRGG